MTWNLIFFYWLACRLSSSWLLFDNSFERGKMEIMACGISSVQMNLFWQNSEIFIMYNCRIPKNTKFKVIGFVSANTFLTQKTVYVFYRPPPTHIVGSCCMWNFKVRTVVLSALRLCRVQLMEYRCTNFTRQPPSFYECLCCRQLRKTPQSWFFRPHPCRQTRWSCQRSVGAVCLSGWTQPSS